MIVSDNKDAELSAFTELVNKTNLCLNEAARKDPRYFSSKDGVKLEKDVFDFISRQSEGTEFENTIELKSGKLFPDIVAKRYYGIEVKSSTQDHWVTLGNSVNESTRLQDVKRIFLVYGKLKEPIEFRAKPYEQCLSDVVVTHYPRYKVDMDIANGETIFDKINVDYDTLRNSSNFIEPIIKYYKEKSKPGESIWWIDNGAPTLEEASPITIKLFSTLSVLEKENLILKGMIRFPEIFGNSSKKYDNLILWMASRYGIISASTRDSFSAGGQCSIVLGKEAFTLVPRKLAKIHENNKKLYNELLGLTDDEMKVYWKYQNDDPKAKLNYWLNQVVTNIETSFSQSKRFLELTFSEWL